MPRTTASSLPPATSRTLRAVAMRWRWLALARGLAWTITSCALALLLALAADRWLFLGTATRVALTIGVLATVLVTISWRLVRPLCRAPDSRRVARGVEARHSFGGELLSLVELQLASDRQRFDGRPSDRALAPAAGLVAMLAERVDARCASVDPRRIVPSRSALRAAMLAAAAAGALGIWTALDAHGVGLLLARLVAPTRELPRPSRVELRVEVDRGLVARGEPVEVTATLIRGDPDAARLVVRHEGESPIEITLSEDPRSVEATSPRVWRHRFQAVVRPIELRARSGDFESASISILPRDPPRSLRHEIEVRPPAYSGLPVRRVEVTRPDLSALSGASVSIRTHVDRDLASASLVFASGERLNAEFPARGDRVVAEFHLPVESDTTFRLELVDADGLVGVHGDYRVHAILDRAPLATVLEPSTSALRVEPLGTLRVVYRAEDDLGVARVELRTVLEESPDSPRILVLHAEGAPDARRRLLDGEHELSIASLGLAPGASASLRLRVVDGLGQTTDSEKRELRAAYPPPPLHHERWTPRWWALERGLGRMSALADPATLDRDSVVTLRAIAGDLATEARELAATTRARTPPSEVARRIAHELVESVEEEGAELWTSLLSPDGSSRGSGPSLERLRARLDRLTGAARAQLAAIELEERFEMIRLLELDTALLARDAARLAGDRATPADDSREVDALRIRARRLLSASVSLAADATAEERALESLGEAGEAILVSARALASSYVAELEPIARSELPGIVVALERATEAVSRRLRPLERELPRTRARALEIAARPAEALDLASLLEGLGDARAGDGTPEAARRDRLVRARRVLRGLAVWRDDIASSAAADFDAAALLELFAELVVRLVETAPDSTDAESAARPDAELARTLAGAWRATQSFLEHAKIAARLASLAEAQESLAWTTRALIGGDERALGATRRGQVELLDALRLAQIEVARARHVDSGPLAASLGEARESFERALELLRARPFDVDPARVESETAATRVLEALEIVSRHRDAALEDARVPLEELRALRGSLVERLLRMARTIDDLSAAQTTAREGAALLGEGSLARLQLFVADHDRVLSRLGSMIEELALESNRRAADAESDPAARAIVSLRAVRSSALSRARASVVATLSTDREDRLLLLAASSEALDVAARELRAIAEALRLLADEGLRALDAPGVDALIDETLELADDENASAEEIAERAERLRAAAVEAASSLASGKPAGWESIVEILGRAATSLERARELARAGEVLAARAALTTGLDRFAEAIALARRLRGEAEDALGPTSDPDTPTADSDPAEADPLAAEIARVRADLERLVALRERAEEARRLLDELLRAEDPSDEAVERAAAAEDLLAAEIAAGAEAAEDLVRLVAELAALGKRLEGVAETQRHVEERAREALAQNDELARARLRDELAPREREAIATLGQVFTSLETVASRLALQLPQVFRSCRAALAAMVPTRESMEAAARALGAADAPTAVRASEAANARLIELLATLDAARSDALDALARTRDGASSRAMAEAAASAREAAKAARAGQLAEAREQHGRAGSKLDVAGRAMMRRLEAVALAGGDGEGLVPAELQAEAARLGLVWELGTRGESFAADESLSTDDRWADLPYPVDYRALVEAYLRAIAKRGR